MKTAGMIGWVAGMCAIAVADDSALLLLRNGDQLPGRLLRMEQELCWWESSLLIEPAGFSMGEIQEMRHTQRPMLVENGQHRARVECHADLRQQHEKRGGDVFSGQLRGLNDEVVILETPYAGLLRLPRAMVRSIQLKETASRLYAGPADASEWQVEPAESWEFAARSWKNRAAGHVSREFSELPARYRFSFRLQWQQQLNLMLRFAQTGKADESQSYYALNIDEGMVHLQKEVGDGAAAAQGGMIGEPVRLNWFRNRQQADLSVAVDTESGTIVLMAGDEVLQQWTDALGAPLTGKTWMFLHMNDSTGDLTISHCLLESWDGLQGLPPLALQRAIEVPEPRSGEQELVLSNGDILVAEVKGVEGEMLRLQTRWSELALPVARLRQIALKTAQHEERLLKKGDVRAWLDDGDSITFRIAAVDANGRWLGESQNFGEAWFDPQAFTRVEFNLYPSLLPKSLGGTR